MLAAENNDEIATTDDLWCYLSNKIIFNIYYFADNLFSVITMIWLAGATWLCLVFGWKPLCTAAVD